MSFHARQVLAALDLVAVIQERHPMLYQGQLRADRTCGQLARAFEMYKQAKAMPVGGRTEHDEVERIDAHAEERMSREREEHHRGRRLRLNAHERSRRVALPGLALVREVIEQAKTISTVRAGNVEPGRHGGESTGPARQQRLQDDPRWKLAETIVHREALILYELIDEARGLSTSAAMSALTAEEKDKTLQDMGAGLSAEELYRRLGPEYGSITYIRRKRREEWNLDTRGRPKPERAT